MTDINNIVANIQGLLVNASNYQLLIIFVISASVSLFYAIYGRLRFQISFFQPLQELSYKQRNYTRERELYEFKTEMADYYVKLGDSLLDVSQLEAAKDAYKKARNFDPKNIDANMGILKSEVFQPILTKEPTFYDMEKTIKKIELIKNYYKVDRHALYFLGEIYRDVNHEEAKKFYNQVINLNLNSDLTGLAKFGLSWIALKEKDKTKALALIQGAKAICQWNPVIQNGLGYIYLVNGDYEQSIKVLNSLLDSNPYIVTSHWNIIQAYRMVGKIEGSYVYSQKLINCIEDEDVFSLETNRRLNLIEIDSSGEAILLKGIIEKKCYSYCTVALTYHLMKHEEEASTYIGKALKLDSCDQTLIKKVLYYNIDCLQQKYKELTPILNNFKNKI